MIGFSMSISPSEGFWRPPAIFVIFCQVFSQVEKEDTIARDWLYALNTSSDPSLSYSYPIFWSFFFSPLLQRGLPMGQTCYNWGRRIGDGLPHPESRYYPAWGGVRSVSRGWFYLSSPPCSPRIGIPVTPLSLVSIPSTYLWCLVLAGCLPAEGPAPGHAWSGGAPPWTQLSVPSRSTGTLPAPAVLTCIIFPPP